MLYIISEEDLNKIIIIIKPHPYDRVKGVMMAGKDGVLQASTIKYCYIILYVMIDTRKVRENKFPLAGRRGR